MKLIYKIKPLVEQRDNAKEIKAMQEEFKENKEKLEKETKMREELQETIFNLSFFEVKKSYPREISFKFGQKFSLV